MQTIKIAEYCNSVQCCSIDFMCLPKTSFKRIVVIGGGFAGLELVKGLKNKNVQVILIDKNNFHHFQPLLYQVATSGLEPDSIVFPLRKQLHGYKNVTFRLAEVLKIETSTNTILTNNGKLNYDFLVLATGTVTNFFGIKSIQNNSLGLKEIRDSLNIRHMMLQNLELAAITCNELKKEALTNFVIVGAGPAGIEMAGALAEFRNYILKKDYPEYSSSIMKIHIVEASNKILSTMSDNAASKTLKYLKDLNVNVLLNEIVIDYDGNEVTTKSGNKIQTKNLIWTAGVKGQFPIGISNQSIANGNRLKTNANLKIEGYENIYAIGDIAAVIAKNSPNGYPQVAQPAIQQGKYLAKALWNIIHKKQIVSFEYKDKGSLATIGKRKAVADLGNFKFSGYFAWLLWSFVHLMSISGFKNKLLIGLNWALSYFTYDKSNRLIIRNYKR